MTTFVDDILCATFGAEVPPRVHRLVDREICLRRIEDYKLGPILPIGAARGTRVAISNQDEPARFRRAVLDEFRVPGLERFLGSVPETTRRMIDTDGVGAVVYLDDLQELSLSAPDGRPLMFSSFDTSNGRMGYGTRHSEPPLDLLGGRWRDALDRLLDLGAVGLWCVRWERRRPSGLVWVSESRHRKNPEQSVAIVEALGSHSGWDACRRLAAGAGLMAYADAIEAIGDGSWDVTVGFCRVG